LLTWVGKPIRSDATTHSKEHSHHGKVTQEMIMGWSVHVERRVAEAVIAVFNDSINSPGHLRSRLSAVSYSEWTRSYHWLDASGMALYFLARLETLQLQDVLPVETLHRLRQNLSDNRLRTASMLTEFAVLNQAFIQARILFCNLKGFTLSPDSCPDPTLRCQLDFDFLVDGKDLEVCRQILAKAGYVLMGSTSTVWEFKAGTSALARIEDHYKVKPQRSVEIHFFAPETGVPARDPRLDRLRWRKWEEYYVPTLAPVDQFIGQALHLFGHLNDSSTRIAWLLEYKRNILAHYSDHAFWESVRMCAENKRQAEIAIGLSTLLAFQLFGGEAPPQLNHWSLERLPPAVKLWAECYGYKSLFAGFPGTKLYLFLRDALCEDNPSWHKERRSNLLPLHRPPRIVYTDPGDSLRKKLRAQFVQLCFILFRLRFHTVEGLRYIIEVIRWKHSLAALHGPKISHK
jgi:hypothetical protein